MLIEGDSQDRSIVHPLIGTNGVWEPHVVTRLADLVQPDWVCLDIGANIGIHALVMAALAPEGSVVAFEAGAANFEHLDKNVSQLGDKMATITVVKSALWDEPGQLQFATVSDLAGCSFIALDEGAAPTPPTDEPVRMEIVEAVRLDDALANVGFQRVDFIKMDVEGAEERVLAGAAQTLRRYKPILLTEYNPGCANYFHRPPDAYFRLLRRLYATIQIIESDGSLSEPVTKWAQLETRLLRGKGWEDLLCSPLRQGRFGRLRGKVAGR
jgi:FkbM family methyltransferase